MKIPLQALAPWVAPALALALVVGPFPAAEARAARPPARRPGRPVVRTAPPRRFSAPTRPRTAGRLRATSAPVASPAVAPPPPPTPIVITIGASEIAGRILDLTNAERAAAGLAPLAWSDRLASAAKAHAADLSARGIVEHVVDGGTPLDRAGAVGYPAAAIGENLFRALPVAIDLALADGVVAAWMNSPEHRAEILSPEFVEMGVGAILAPIPVDRLADWPDPSLRDLFAVQLFARPLPLMAVEPDISPYIDRAPPID